MLSHEKLLQLVDSTFSRDKQRQLYRGYIEGLIQRDLPPLLSLQHLADEIEIPNGALAKMCFSTGSFYRTFYIPKRSGSLRRIDAPLPSLAKVQSWLTAHLISKLPIDSDAACAYEKDCSIKKHVSSHVSQPYLLKLDLAEFFPSISTQRIAYLLASNGYQGALATTIAHLLTLDGSLPQGAPSSPSMSNVVMREVDGLLRGFSLSRGLKYTRYADDLAFSGESVTDVDLRRIEAILESNGFRLNPRKTKLFRPNMNGRLLTGLVINGDVVRVPRSTRRKIKQTVYYLDRYFLSDLGVRKSPIENANNSLSRYAHLDPIGLDRAIGQLLFWKWIEPTCDYVPLALEKLRQCQRSVLELLA